MKRRRNKGNEIPLENQPEFVLFRPIIPRKLNRAEMEGATEEEILEKANKLRAKHEYLMQNDERYRQLYESLPDRSGFKSDVPITAPICQSLFSIYRRALYDEKHTKEWGKLGHEKIKRRAQERKEKRARGEE